MAQKVTEEEAKKKWCRHARQFDYREKTYVNDVGVGAAATNRTDGGFAKPKCYGSDCMAWEWDEEGNVNVEKDKHKGFCDAENNGGKVAIL